MIRAKLHCNRRFVRPRFSLITNPFLVVIVRAECFLLLIGTNWADGCYKDCVKSKILCVEYENFQELMSKTVFQNLNLECQHRGLLEGWYF